MSTFNRKALLNKVIVKLDREDADLHKKDGEYLTKGGIAIPKMTQMADTEERKKMAVESGTVVSIGYGAGKGVGDGRCEVREGSHVGFKRYAGNDCTPKDSEDLYRIMEDEDLLFLIEE